MTKIVEAERSIDPGRLEDGFPGFLDVTERLAFLWPLQMTEYVIVLASLAPNSIQDV